jgi:hypothetical protein
MPLNSLYGNITQQIQFHLRGQTTVAVQLKRLLEWNAGASYSSSSGPEVFPIHTANS